MNLLRCFYYLFLFTLGLFLFQNCGAFKGVDGALKQKTLAQHAGLGDDFLDQGQRFDNGTGGLPTSNGGVNKDQAPQYSNNDDDGIGNNGDGSANLPGDGNGFFNFWGQTFGTMNPDEYVGQFETGDDPITNPQLGRMNVMRWCRRRNKGATLKAANSITIKLYNKQTGQTICDASGVSMLNQILNDGFVDIPNCDFSGVNSGDLVAHVSNEHGRTLSDGASGAHKDNAFSDRWRDKPGFSIIGLHLLKNTLVKPPHNQVEGCDAYNVSPLVVDMRTDPELRQELKLTSPSFGVVFDILGKNSYPAEHTKKKISWFEDPRIMPIVLPFNGDVQGVDQMFGDNTFGPDNKFAADGFAALAKYDGLDLKTNEVRDPDGYITEDDEVYSLLRLWHDKNLNGRVDRGELLSLRDVGIDIIDLDYDPNYYSRDDYGNEIKYKSVVKLKSGKYKPVFDIWFAIINHIQN